MDAPAEDNGNRTGMRQPHLVSQAQLIVTEPDGASGAPRSADGAAPRQHIDLLLKQLISRGSEVLAARDGLRKLVAANRSILGKLSLPEVLAQVVDSARDLTGAQYAALGVIGPDGKLEQFIHSGMNESTVSAIGPLPRGEGLLGALIQQPEPIRLPDLAADSRSAGFPANHPAMTSFLGVPIKLREEVYGNLYLTDSISGEFSEDDTELALSLAGTAAIAIENARLYADARRRQDWLQASTEITRRLLTGTDGDPLTDIAGQVRLMADADVVSVVLPVDNSPDFRIAVATGEGEDQLRGLVYPADATLSQAVMQHRKPIRIANAQQAKEIGISLLTVVPVGPVMALPLTGSAQPRGVLLVGRLAGRAPFTLAQMDMAATFADHASLALELADNRALRERMGLLEDRGRIARDLHDHVIQRLFAAGMTLQSVLLLPVEKSADRISQVVDEIDATIKQIRTSIFALEGVLDHQPGARALLLQAIEPIGAGSQLVPEVTFSGPIDTLLTGSLLAEVVAVLREGVTNVYKHSQAAAVSVTVSVAHDQVAVCIDDDGQGVSSTVTRRSGVANLKDRADALNGTFDLTSEPGKGTHLTWTAPLI